MDKETLRMQMLAGLITESQYKNKLNEVKIDNLSEDKHIVADYNTDGGTSEEKFARVLADNVMAGYDRGNINDLYDGGEWDDIRNGDPNNFYTSMEESISVFKSLPNTFTITAEGMDDEPFTFKVTKIGEIEYNAEEI